MHWTHESLGTIRGLVTVIIVIALAPCGDLVATLQAATPSAQSTYQSSGSPHPDEARGVVMNLGVGRFVAVRLSSGQTVRGYIRDIAGDHFALLLDGMAVPVDIAYVDVRQLRPVPQPVLRSRAPLPVKIEQAASVALFVGFLVTAFVTCRNRSC